MNDKACPTCEVSAGETCQVTLSDRTEELSIKWQHRTREEAE